MVFDYFSFARAKKNQEELEKTNPQNPVLNEDDEQFLEKVASQDETDEPEKEATRSWASLIPTASVPKMPSISDMTPAMPKLPSLPSWKGKSPSKGTDNAPGDNDATEGYPPGVKVSENVTIDESQRDEEEKEVTVLLDRLNLSSINNRVFAFSEQSQKLYSDFIVVLKDIINGVPTAYQDLEELFKKNDALLRGMNKTLPSFMKSLISSLSATLAPALKTSTQPSKERSAGLRAAVTAALHRSVSALRLRFPLLFTGANVMMMLAVLVLLFAIWYCHKRGRETRLEQEGTTDDEGEAEGASYNGTFTDEEIKEQLERGSKTQGPSDGPEAPTG